VIGQNIRMPLRYMPAYMSDPAFEDIFTNMFGNWKYHLHELKDQDAFFEALRCLFDSQHPSRVYYNVFEAAFECVGFWDRIPKKYKDLLITGYHLMNEGDRSKVFSRTIEVLGIKK
ncbi:MAG: hypothetical protein J6A01_02280, partial [Proteobacteria bacterium]|nr:hypothetical protein [Pseudomonadota bacterium]